MDRLIPFSALVTLKKLQNLLVSSISTSCTSGVGRVETSDYCRRLNSWLHSGDVASLKASSGHKLPFTSHEKAPTKRARLGRRYRNGCDWRCCITPVRRTFTHLRTSPVRTLSIDSNSFTLRLLCDSKARTLHGFQVESSYIPRAKLPLSPDPKRRPSSRRR